MGPYCGRNGWQGTKDDQIWDIRPAWAQAERLVLGPMRIDGRCGAPHRRPPGTGCEPGLVSPTIPWLVVESLQKS